MPNGGSDCCWNCWFKRDVREQLREEGLDTSGLPAKMVGCAIRNLRIRAPFYTYCANHPHHNPARVDVPVGPVWVTEGYPYDRVVWHPAPTDPETRDRLVDALNTIEVVIRDCYPSGIDLDEALLREMIELREERAIPRLLEIVATDLEPFRKVSQPPTRNPAVLVGLAAEGVLTIGGDRHLDRVAGLIVAGLDGWGRGYYSEEDGLAVVRYHVVRGLAHCSSAHAIALLERGMQDPHTSVRQKADRVMDALMSR